MKKRNFFSIRLKLVVLQGLSAILALVLSSVAIFAYTYYQEKESLLKTLSQLSGIMAENLIPSVDFDDSESAKTILNALKQNPNIIGAVVYKQEDAPFAVYNGQNSVEKEWRESVRNTLGGHALNLPFQSFSYSEVVTSTPMQLDGEHIGALCIIADTKNLDAVIVAQIIAQLLVAVVSLFIIILLAFKLQHIFTRPIFKLKSIMDTIAADGKYIRIDATSNDEFQSLYNGFNYMIATINEKTGKIKSLLDNAGQGFLLFDENFLIESEYSRECRRYLGNDLADHNIADTLFKNESDHTLFTETIREITAQEDDILRDSLISLLPKEIILNRRALKLEYKQLSQKRFMMIITNISAQKKLEKKIKQEQNTLKMIVEVVSQSEMFYETKHDFEHFKDNVASYVDASHTVLFNLNECYRKIHTFKGTFSQMFMLRVVNALHRLESDISELIKSQETTNGDLIELLQSFDFETPFSKELETIASMLGEEFVNASSFIKVSADQIHMLQDKINSMASESSDIPDSCKEVVKSIQKITRPKLMELLKPYNSLVSQLSQNLDKAIYPFRVLGDENLTVDENIKPFIKSLVHVFRNSLDHGIETSDVRLAEGKDEKGTLTCNFIRRGNTLQLLIADNGSGIDTDTLLSKALEKGLIAQEQIPSLDKKAILDFIFNDRFSTKEEVSELSGRGVGMGAVKAELLALGGSYEIQSEPHTGTTFIFTLPYKEI